MNPSTLSSEELCTKHENMIRKISLAMKRDYRLSTVEVEDLQSEQKLALLQVPKDKWSNSAYGNSVCINTAKNWLSKNRRIASNELPVLDTVPEPASGVDPDLWLMSKQAFEALTSDQKAVISAFLGLSSEPLKDPATLAKATGLPVSRIPGLIRSGMAVMKRIAGAS